MGIEELFLFERGGPVAKYTHNLSIYPNDINIYIYITADSIYTDIYDMNS